MSGVPFSSMILLRYFALVIVFISSPTFKSRKFFISWNCFDVLIILSANSIYKRSLSKTQNILFFESGDYVKATWRLPQALTLSCLHRFIIIFIDGAICIIVLNLWIVPIVLVIVHIISIHPCWQNQYFQPCFTDKPVTEIAILHEKSGNETIFITA